MAAKRMIPLLVAAAVAVAVSVIVVEAATAGGLHGSSSGQRDGARATTTSTPIQHVVVIFGENISFDHYFGTYPNATNVNGVRFQAAPGTRAVDGLLPATSSSLPPSLRHSDNLLTSNPNSALPRRLDSSPTGLPGSPGGQLTCDQDHNYSDEQKAFDNGKMDKFVESVGNAGGTSPFGTPCQAAQVMDYYDGNTVTGLWNYAQHFAISDNSYDTTFGPSSPGAINLISGDTGAVDMSHTANNPSIASSTSPNADLTADGQGGYSLTSDAQPYWDDCSTRDAVAMSGKNVGDELNAAGLSWGWFQGGERPSISLADALAATGANQQTSTFTPDQFKNAGFQNQVPHSSNQGICDTVHPIGVAIGGTGQWGYKDDYIPHHEPFNYYASTANPHHLTIPVDGNGNDTVAGLQSIGHDTQSFANGAPEFNTPNHQYDMSDFDQLVAAITAHRLPPSALPAVSFLKASGYQDAHAGYSDPRDEQRFVVSEINALEKSSDWSSTAVVIAYDDSDGWYDHQPSPLANPSLSVADNLTNTTLSGPTSGQCGPSPQTTAPLGGEQGRCGLGPRQPLMVISPFAGRGVVDHHVSNLASIINLVEYNWHLPGIAGSYDQLLTRLEEMQGLKFDLAGLFNFHGPLDRKLFLFPSNGLVVRGWHGGLRLSPHHPRESALR